MHTLTWNIILPLGCALLLLGISAVVSMAKAALFSLSPHDISEIKKSSYFADSLIQKLLASPEYLSATISLVNKTANVAFILFCVYSFSLWINFSKAPVLCFIIGTAILTLILLLFGEILPRIYGQQNPQKRARLTAPILEALEKICKPISSLLVRTTEISNVPNGKVSDFPTNELSKTLDFISNEAPKEKKLLKEIINFHNKTADEIMTSRLDLKDVDINTSFKEVIELIINSGFSRIPVYEESVDNIKGILYCKDLFPYLNQPDDFHWQNLIRPAYFIPETKKINDLLEEFKKNKIHLAIVVDEFGGTSGIVTLEDILEEIVGDISDEFDKEEQQYIQLADGSYIFEGKILLTDFFRITGIESSIFDEMTEDVETLAGLLLEIKGDYPSQQEIIKYKGYCFQVLEADDRRILKIKYFSDIPQTTTNDNKD